MSVCLFIYLYNKLWYNIHQYDFEANNLQDVFESWNSSPDLLFHYVSLYSSQVSYYHNEPSTSSFPSSLSLSS